MNHVIDNPPNLSSIIAAQQKAVGAIEAFIDRYGPAMKPHVLHDFAVGLEHANIATHWLVMGGVGLGYGRGSLSTPAVNPPDSASEEGRRSVSCL